MSLTSQVPDRHGFTLSDFALTILAGFAGVFVVALTIGSIADTPVLLVASLLGQYAGHLLGLWVVVRRRQSSFGALGLHVEPSDGLYVLGGVTLQILIALAFVPVAEWIGGEGSTQSLAEQIPSVRGATLQAGLILAVALIAPVTEEIMFRGLLPRALGRWMGQGASFAVAALVFAVFHLLGVTPDDFVRSALLLLPQLFIVGLILGWQVMRRRRLGTAIFLHSGFNLVAVLALLVAPETFS
ncbi:MAG TPA: type II CAAX endopeptidase family protein [Acidimicrobiia bacterium]|nr:type II CAAX endopeptidase family protein [Acidimicrobiia bacterium]